MAKKRGANRTDAERRARQCERLSRVLRVLRCIMGPGRWDAEGIAQELECSLRTIHRDLQTLSMAGVPYYYDQNEKAYRVRPGFRFPGLERADSPGGKIVAPVDLLPKAKEMLANAEQFLNCLRTFCALIEASETQP